MKLHKCHECKKLLEVSYKNKWVCESCHSSYLKRVYKNNATTNSPKYWLKHGYSEQDAKRLAKIAGRESSKRCKEYWIKRGYSEEDSKLKVSLIQREFSKRCKEYWIKHHNCTEAEAKQRVSKEQIPNGKANAARGEIALRESSKRCKEYWIKHHNCTEEDAKNKVSDFQNLTSKEAFIKKYGEVEGLKRYDSHCFKATNEYQYAHFSKEEIESRNKPTFKPSKMSQELFDMIFEKLSPDLCEHTYYANLNKEFGKQDVQNLKYYFYDFVITDIKICIEFNGDVFHANPIIFESNDEPNPYNNVKAEDIWKFDRQKLNLLTDLGFKVLVIWEKDWMTDKINELNKCLKFIQGAQNAKN